MRRPFIAVLLAGWVALVGAPARAAETAGRALIVSMPAAEAVAFAGDDMSIGIGVYPPSRDARAFLEQVGSVAPAGAGSPGGAPGSVAALLGTVRVAVAPSMAGRPPAALADGFPGDRVALAAVLAAGPQPGATLAVVRSADDARDLAARTEPDLIVVLGVRDGAQTPVFVALTDAEQPMPGVLTGGIARRQSIVTPYDIGATVVDSVGGDGTAVAGGVLTTVPGDARARADTLASRLLADADIGEPLTQATFGAGLVCLMLGGLALMLRRRRTAAAFARAAALVPAGYVVALFIHDARWQVRATAVAGAIVLGVTTPSRDSRRACGWALLVTAVAVAALTIVAAVRPDGEPALSLWADPLVSWRFFGLRNHLAAFVAGGTVAGLALVRARAGWLAAGGLVAAVVVGAPMLGANFIGVLTLVFGAILAAAALRARAVRWWHPLLAAIVASAATVVALLSDAGSQISHGGRAVDTIRSGGIEAAWRIVRGRARLNLEEIQRVGLWGWAGLAVTVLVLAAAFTWAVRTGGPVGHVRAAVAGTAAAGLAALVVEDSGFLTAMVMALYPLVALLVAFADPGMRPEAPTLVVPRSAGPGPDASMSTT